MCNQKKLNPCGIRFGCNKKIGWGRGVILAGNSKIRSHAHARLKKTGLRKGSKTGFWSGENKYSAIYFAALIG
jgi:hypothetical protein